METQLRGTALGRPGDGGLSHSASTVLRRQDGGMLYSARDLQ